MEQQLFSVLVRGPEIKEFDTVYSGREGRYKFRLADYIHIPLETNSNVIVTDENCEGELTYELPTYYSKDSTVESRKLFNEYKKLSSK